MTLGDLEIKQDSDWEDIVYFATNTPNGTFTYNGNEYTVCTPLSIAKRSTTVYRTP